MVDTFSQEAHVLNFLDHTLNSKINKLWRTSDSWIDGQCCCWGRELSLEMCLELRDPAMMISLLHKIGLSSEPWSQSRTPSQIRCLEMHPPPPKLHWWREGSPPQVRFMSQRTSCSSESVSSKQFRTELQTDSRGMQVPSKQEKLNGLHLRI